MTAHKDEFKVENRFSIVVLENACDVTMMAVHDFTDYLFASMKISAMMELSAEENCVKISLNQDIEEASGYMGYRITVSYTLKEGLCKGFINLKTL